MVSTSSLTYVSDWRQSLTKPWREKCRTGFVTGCTAEMTTNLIVDDAPRVRDQLIELSRKCMVACKRMTSVSAATPH